MKDEPAAWAFEAPKTPARNPIPPEQRAKLPPTIRLYDLRHTTCTLLLAAGLNVKVVSERLGHSSAAMTLDV